MIEPPRSVFRRSDLDCVVAPASIAIIGASPTPKSLGNQTAHNLRHFPGPLYLVNSRYQRIGEAQCYPSVSALPSVPDCAVLAIGRDAVLDIVEECAAIGVKGVVIYASGFAETGESERRAQQARLSAIARETGLRIVGPNCLGLFNHIGGFAIAFSPGVEFAEPSSFNIGLISQSGGISNGLTQALHHGVPLSHSLSAGNACDVDMADYVAYLAEEPKCHAIALVFEGLAAPARLIEAGQIAASNDKPLIVYKTGRGAIGAQAALSHSGFLAGSDEAYMAAFRRAGAIVADSTTELIEFAAFFAKARAPLAKGIAVIANSGGAAVISADEAENCGVPMPQPGSQTLDVLRRNMDDFAVPRNPCDAQAGVMNNAEKFSQCADALLADPEYGALLLPYLYCRDSPEHIARTEALDELAGRHGKMAVQVWMSEWLEGPGSTQAARLPNLAVFRDMRRAFRALAAWHDRADGRREGRRADRMFRPPEAAAAATALLATAKNKVLTEREAKEALSPYGIPVVREQLVTTGQDAVAAARVLGFPVAIKVESPDLPHKTEAGVIRLGLNTEADVVAAYDAIMMNARKVTPMPRINGVLVQPMAPHGTEMMIGARVDQQFGAIVVVGLGGIFVELLKDTAVDLAPVTKAQALAMLARLKGQSVLDGFRGAPRVNRDLFADTIVRVSEFIADQAKHVVELDINPLICTESGAVAVDALIVKS